MSRNYPEQYLQDFNYTNQDVLDQVIKNGQYPQKNGRYPEQNGQYPQQNGQYPQQNGQYIPTIMGKDPEPKGISKSETSFKSPSGIMKVVILIMNIVCVVLSRAVVGDHVHHPTVGHA